MNHSPQSTPASTRRGWSLATIVSVTAFVGYSSSSRMVVDFFPFSVLNMYSHASASRASRILARDAHGRAYELDRFDRWSCPAALDPAARTCPGFAGVNTVDYVDREMAIFLDTHRGRPGEGAPVDVVRRAWTLTDHPGPPAFEDCALLHCRAVRRP